MHTCAACHITRDPYRALLNNYIIIYIYIIYITLLTPAGAENKHQCTTISLGPQRVPVCVEWAVLMF